MSLVKTGNPLQRKEARALLLPLRSDGPLTIRGMKSPLSDEERERIIRDELDNARPLSEFWEKMRTKYPDTFAEPN
jgi:hypothetical protein